MTCIQHLHAEVCIRAVLSAVWNLSAHNSENKEEICRTTGSLKYLGKSCSWGLVYPWTSGFPPFSSGITEIILGDIFVTGLLAILKPPLPPPTFSTALKPSLNHPLNIQIFQKAESS